MIKTVLLLLLVSASAYADTPPIIDIFKLKGENRTGVVKVDSGVVGNIAPGSSGNVLTSNGTTWTSATPAASGVTSVTASSPLSSSGGTTPNLTLQAADASHNGYLSLVDWSSFNSKPSSAQLAVKTPVVVAATGDTPLTGSSPLVIDGVTVANGDRVLLPVQNAGTDNGIYACADNGTSYTLTRATDANTSAALTPGVAVMAQKGTYRHFLWQHATDTFPFVLGATSQVWTTAQDVGVSYGGNFFLRLDGGTTMQADLNLGGNKGTNAAEPVLSTDLATKNYVDTHTSTVSDATTISKGIVQLAGDLGGTAAAPTVNSVGGSSAADVHLAEIAANAATSLSTANAIMKRDSGGSVSATFNYSPTTPGDWSWTTTPSTHGGALDSIANWIKNVATNLSNLLDTRTLYVSKTAILTSDSNSCSYFLPCLTIQRGINVANGLAAYYKQVTVRVSPGTTSGAYTENLTLSQQGVNLVCDSPQTADRRCNLVGTITVNLTGTSGGAQFIAASNEVYIHGMVTTAGAGNDAITFSGSTWQRLVVSHSYFQASSGHAAVVSNNGFTSGTPSEFRSYDTTFENNSATIPTVLESAGRFWLYGTTPTVQNDNASGPSFLHNPTATTTGNLTSGSACIASPGSLTGIAVGQTISDTTSLVNSVNITAGTKVAAIPGTCSAGQIQMSANAAGSETGATLNFGGSSMIANVTQFVGQYQLADNTATATFNLSTIASGTASCISTPAIPNVGYALIAYFGCNSSNANSITGSGIVVNAPGNARFGSSGDIASTVTQSNIGPGLPQGEVMIGNGATTGTNVLLSILNGHVKVSQTTAPTASPSANAGTSATCTLTNGRDSSGIINLTEGSGSWASGTQCTITFNKAYGVAPNCVAWPHNAAAASHLVTQQVFSTTTTTTLLLSFGAADSAATASQWSYKCEEP